MDKSKKENMDKSILLGIVSSTQNATYSEKGKRWRSAVVVGVGGAVVVGAAVLLMNTTTPVPANQSHRKKEALVLILLVIVVTHQRKTSKKNIKEKDFTLHHEHNQHGSSRQISRTAGVQESGGG